MTRSDDVKINPGINFHGVIFDACMAILNQQPKGHGIKIDRSYNISMSVGKNEMPTLITSMMIDSRSVDSYTNGWHHRE